MILLSQSAHEVAGRISAYKTIQNFTRKIKDEEEDLNEFRPPSKRAKNDKAEQPQTRENKIIIDPGNNPFYARSNYEPSSDGSWRPECKRMKELKSMKKIKNQNQSCFGSWDQER